MIPSFNEHGYLPPGVHSATLDEIEDRFGTESEIRRVQCESLRWLVGAAIDAGMRRLVLNGSFVTDMSEPNDVDCLLLIDDRVPVDKDSEQALREGFPFLDIELADARTFAFYIDRVYATDRRSIQKGLIEVLL